MELRVVTHSGEEDFIEVENYNPQEMNELLNNNEIYTVLIGDEIYSRIDIKKIGIVKK